MVKINFRSHDGDVLAVETPLGGSVMEAAIAEGVPGIEAQCYGAGVCGTCHIFVHEDIRSAINPPSEWEIEMLEMLSATNAGSRLACQIEITANLDGAQFQLPESQEKIA